MLDVFPDQLTRTTTIQRTDLVIVETKPDVTGQEETKGMPALDLAKGWIEIPDSWTYNGPGAINVPSDATLLYQKGWGIRFKQGGAYKYMYMTTVAAALLTVNGGSDYAVANAAITDIAVCPNPSQAFGFPDWFNLAAPTFTVSFYDNGAGGQPTTSSHRLCIRGKTAIVKYKGNGTKAGTDAFIAISTSNMPTPANTPAVSVLGGCLINTAGGIFVGKFVLTATNPYLAVVHANVTDNTVITDFTYQLEYEY